MPINPAAESDRRGPIECVERGLRSLRANWQLVPALVAQSLLTGGLAVAGLLVLLAGLGISLFAWLRNLQPGWQERLIEDLAFLEPTPGALLPLLLPLLGATLVWTLAFALYCYIQGGIVGVLAEADAAAGGGRPSWRAFRQFSMASFDRLGRRLFWPYFWFYHLVGAVFGLWTTCVLLLVALVVRLLTGEQPALGAALGCAGTAPLALALLAAGVWSLLAMVEVARPGGGVLEASRRAFGTLVRRLGAVAVIWSLALAGWVAVSAALAPLGWGIELAMGDELPLRLGARGALLTLEAILGNALFVALIAALAALTVAGAPRAAEVGR